MGFVGRLLLLVAVLGALLGGIVAVDRDMPRPDLTVRYSSIGTLDPQRARALEDIQTLYALFEGLYTYDAATFEIQPGVAKSHEVSDDGRTYTFHLRKDARWSNGDRVTAEDFLFAWRLGMMPDVAPHYIQFLFYIRGARDFFDWAQKRLERAQAIDDRERRMRAARERIEASKKKFRELVGARAPDPFTLVVELEHPTPYFLDIVAFPTLFPLHRETLRAASSVHPETLRYRRDPQWTKAGRMVSNGPYRLKAWRFKRSIRLVANDQYWNADAVGPESVKLLCIHGPNTAYTAYQSGVIDLFQGAGELPYAPELLKQMRAGREDVHTTNGFGTYYYLFNNRPTLPDGRDNPFTDPRVRRAFSMAVDKRAIVKRVTRLEQKVATSLVPPYSLPNYDPPKGLGFHPDRARELLAKSGHPEGEGLGPVSISYNTGADHADVAQAVGRMWREHLGVDVSFESMEWKVFLEARNDGNFVVARGGWFGDYPDPTTFLNLLVSDNGNNDSGFSDPRYDRMLERAKQMSDPAKRRALLRRAEAYVLQEKAPVLPVYHYRLIHLFDADRLRGVSLHPRNLQMYHQMSVRADGG